MTDLDQVRIIRDAYIERRSVNKARDEKLHALINTLGKPQWDELQQNCQVVALLTIVKSQLMYLIETFDPEGREYELELVLEDLRDNPLFKRIIQSPLYEYINEIGRTTTPSIIRSLEGSIVSLSQTIMTTLGGQESDTYRDYMDYTQLGSKSTALKIRLNGTVGSTPMFFT